MLMPKQIWRPVIGYEGLYEVSNGGKVKSLDRTDCAGRKLKGRILKQMVGKDGYKQVTLSKNGKTKTVAVHRIVAQVFIEKENIEHNCVNHKDENKLNNCYTNLEWCSYQYNNSYGTKPKRISEKNRGKYVGENNPMYGKHHTEEVRQKISKAHKGKRKGANSPRARKVMCLNNGIIFDTVTEACEWCGLKSTGNIVNQIQGKHSYAGRSPITGEELQWGYVEQNIKEMGDQE